MLDDATLMELAKGLGLFVSYGLLGALIKYIDQAFDEGVFERTLATFLALPAGLLMGGLMVLNGASATIFMAIVLAVAITKKIDNIAFQLGAGILFLVPLVFRGIFTIHWLPLGLLLFAGVADELGNDWADRRKMKRAFIETKGGLIGNVHVFARMVEEFLEHRFIMKVVLTGLVLTGTFKVVYLFAFLAFDAAYITVDKLSMAGKRYHLAAAGLKTKKNLVEVMKKDKPHPTIPQKTTSLMNL